MFIAGHFIVGIGPCAIVTLPAAGSTFFTVPTPLCDWASDFLSAPMSFLPIKCPCIRQQSRGFFTAGLSINCACLLKQSCIADSLCAANKAAEDANAMTSAAAVSSAFMADSFGERANV